MTVPHSPTDRRVVIAGMRVATMVTARLLAGQLLAMLASAATIAGLAVRTGIDVPARVAAGTLMFAVTYLAIGAVVGATVRNPVNGTVLIMFVWIIDVFFGPTLSSPDGRLIRAFPTHFTSLWLVDLPSLHGGLGHLPSRVRRRRVTIDGALTNGFDTIRPLLFALAWLGALTIAATVLFRGFPPREASMKRILLVLTFRLRAEDLQPLPGTPAPRIPRCRRPSSSTTPRLPAPDNGAGGPEMVCGPVVPVTFQPSLSATTT